jgi:hypothetical protein
MTQPADPCDHFDRIFDALAQIEAKVDSAVQTVADALTSARNAQSLSEQAANSAHSAADAAQKCMLAFEQVNLRIEALRREHVRNHGQSQVPASIKKREPG